MKWQVCWIPPCHIAPHHSMSRRSHTRWPPHGPSTTASRASQIKRSLIANSLVWKDVDRCAELGDGAEVGSTGCVNALSWSDDGQTLLAAGDDTRCVKPARSRTLLTAISEFACGNPTTTRRPRRKTLIPSSWTIPSQRHTRKTSFRQSFFLGHPI